MRRKVVRNVLAGLLLAGLVGAVQSPHAHALSGITVAPAINNIVLAPTDQDAGFELTITNRNSVVQSVKLTGLDFGSLDESGGLFFIGQKATANQTKYGLNSWLEFDNTALTLNPGQSKAVKVTIDNKQSLAPGGHYAAAVVTPVNENGKGPADHVAVVPSTSALILLRKSGGDVEDLRLDQIDTHGAGRFVFPTMVTLRFQNAGNVHLVPRGVVTVTDSLGHAVAKGIINEDSGFVLPETFRKFPVPLQRLDGRALPGRYTITVAWRYDGSQAFQKSVVKFYYLVHFWYLFLAIACIALICFVVLKTRLWRKVIHRGRKTPV